MSDEMVRAYMRRLLEERAGRIPRQTTEPEAATSDSDTTSTEDTEKENTIMAREQYTEESQDAQAKSAVLEALAELGGNLVQEDALQFQGSEFVLPAQYSGRTQEAIKFLEAHIAQQEKVHGFGQTFRQRPKDVAYGLFQVLRQVFGTTGLGKDTQTMFGSRPPMLETINIGVGATAQVPFGEIEFPPLEGVITVGGVQDREMGALGRVEVSCPRKYRGHVQGLFRALEDYLAHHSIYRGRAIDGADDPAFLDTSKVDPATVVYSDKVLEELATHVWAPIEHTELLRRAGQPIKRTALVHGEYGTGKTLAGYLTAQKAQAAGWTFVFVRPDQNLTTAMRTAQLYAPAVVFFEDIDVVADESDPTKISKLLDTFDGITGKGAEMIAVLTTNHVTKIHKGMLRPGRMDAVIRIGELDAHGVEKLIKSKFAAEMLTDVDYAAVAEAVKGYMPAFVTEAVSRAFRYALVRAGGRVPSSLATRDFTAAAEGLREHLALMTDAHEGERENALDSAFRSVVANVVESTTFLDGDGDPSYYTRKAKVGDRPEN